MGFPLIEPLSLVLGVAVLIFGLVLPMQGFFKLGAMRAHARRQQPAGPPAVGLAVCATVFVVVLVVRGWPAMLTTHGVLANALWLWVVKTRGASR